MRAHTGRHLSSFAMGTDSWRAISFVLAGLATVFYLVAAFRVVMAAIDHPADRGGLLTVLILTVALYLVGVSIAVYERRSAGPGIPVAGAAALGWVLLVLYTAGASVI